MTSIRLLALRPLRIWGQVVDEGRFEASLPTARSLFRSGRARPMDSTDLALLIDDRARTDATLRRVHR